MVVRQTVESVAAGTRDVVSDREDLRIVRALQLGPRASFARIGAALGLPERVVARRYRALRREGILRIFGVVNPESAGQHPWMVRVRCRPDSAESLATALARRDDIRWLCLSNAGADLVFSIVSLSAEQRDTLLTRRLPRTAHVLDIDAAVVLHRFIGGRADDWGGLADQLTAGETADLAAAGEIEPDPGLAPVPLEPADRPLVAALSHDGRASYAELAAAAGMSEGRVTRRLATLLRSRSLVIDMDLAGRAVGQGVAAHISLQVTPSRLEAAGRALSALPEVCFAAAISGRHNLVMTAVCRDLTALYAFVTHEIGALDGVQTCEVSPVLRPVKQAGGLTDERGRLLDPPTAPGQLPRALAG